MTEFNDSLMLLKFLKEKQSTIPDKMAHNSWAVFTNMDNIDKYEQLLKGKTRADRGNILWFQLIFHLKCYSHLFIT